MQTPNSINIPKWAKHPVTYIFIGFLFTSIYFTRLQPVLSNIRFDKTVISQKFNSLTKLFNKGTNKNEPITEPKLVTSDETVITSVVKKALPSVVTIGIDKTISQLPSFRYNPFNPYSPFQEIPGNTQEIKQNIGSGFIVSSDGLIVTNKHVVADITAKYKVIADDDHIYDVVNIYRDSANDLAILKIEAKDLTALELGDSSNLLLGQTVVAVGTPLGEFKNTITKGIVSGLGRGITAGSMFSGSGEKLTNVIQTDAAISPGNSGGPLLNTSAQVVGVNTAIASEGQNIGFAIPVSEVKKLMDLFKQRGGSFAQPYLGVRYKMLAKELAVLNDLPQGAYILEVQQDSPATTAKLQPGDIILEVDSQKISGDTDNALAQLIAGKKVGQDIGIKYWRNGKSQTVRVKLGQLKS